MGTWHALKRFVDSLQRKVHKKQSSENFTNLVLDTTLSNKKLFNAKTPTERTAIERQIQATDKQIDQLVYQLYDLTEEEIKIVEER